MAIWAELYRRGTVMTKTKRAHLITGGYPAGSDAGHDMNYARLRLLEFLAERDGLEVTVAMDFRDIGRWLPETDLLVTYVAGPFHGCGE